MSHRSRRAVSALVVAAIAALLAGTLLAGELAAQRPDCCAGRHPVASIYAKEPNRVERLLLTGDGQVFAALAQDPLLSRPAVLRFTRGVLVSGAATGMGLWGLARLAR